MGDTLGCGHWNDLVRPGTLSWVECRWARELAATCRGSWQYGGPNAHIFTTCGGSTVTTLSLYTFEFLIGRPGYLALQCKFACKSVILTYVLVRQPSNGSCACRSWTSQWILPERICSFATIILKHMHFTFTSMSENKPSRCTAQGDLFRRIWTGRGDREYGKQSCGT